MDKKPKDIAWGALSVFVGVFGAGGRMSGLTSQFIGNGLMVLGVAGVGAVLLRRFVPKVGVRLSRLVRSRGFLRRRDVANQLGNYLEELTELIERVERRLPDSSIRPEDQANYADELLIPWKQKVIEYLDANISDDVVMLFCLVATYTRRSGVHAQIESSHVEHRKFVDDLRVKIQSCEVHVKGVPMPSGKPVPRVKTFVYHSQDGYLEAIFSRATPPPTPPSSKASG